MLKHWIFLTFLVIGIAANSSEWSSEYDTAFDPMSAEDSDIDRDISRDRDEPYIHEVFNDEDNIHEDKYNKLLKQSDDYEVEDNRSIGKYEKNDKEDDSMQNIDNVDGSLDLSDLTDPDDKTFSQEINEDIDEPTSGEIIQKILNETKSILLEDTHNDFEEYSYIQEEVNKNISSTNRPILEETKALLNEAESNDDQDTFENGGTNELIADLVELNDIKNKLDTDQNKKLIQYEDVIDDDDDDDTYEEIDDKNLDQIFENSDATTKKLEESVQVHKVEPLPDDAFMMLEKEKIINYQNDDLLADIEPFLAKLRESDEEPELVENAESLDKTIPRENPKDFENILDTRNLTDAQIDLLLIDFSDKNLKRIQSEVKSARNVQRVLLSVDKPTVITSPGYPNAYPTNSVTDWIVEGIGTGIEFNLTDCAINGHIGDYLLVKPGRADDSGRDGLIFTYTLNTERIYRFLDVDRMFIRFQANAGMQFMRGFSISAKMLVSAPFIYEPEPEPQPESRYVDEKITLNLGGVSLERFMSIEEEFRQIVADMATMYINANNISTTTNNTLDVTQITSRGLCFHNWPKYEQCAEVQFGVPLEVEGERPRLDEEDLHAMWFDYSQMDPFATRLRLLGITEFQVPNDHGVLLVWLVISGGVLISMVMLAFALWRFSCFEDYSRMPAYSDTDSVSEKRKLDMFPTPHQTLPPLFSDEDYKWADHDDHKVNLGYSNRNFLQDDMFDIDSDDDVAPGRNRDKAIQPRDIYSV